MKRFLRRLASGSLRLLQAIPILIICTAVAESITSGNLKAQKGVDFEVAPKLVVWSPRVVHIVTSALYAHWWQEIAECEKLPIGPQIDRVQFYAVNAPEFEAVVDGKKMRVIGLAVPDEDKLFVTLGLIADEALLKHEMLHFLLAWSGYRFKNFHPVEYFETCGIHRVGP